MSPLARRAVDRGASQVLRGPVEVECGMMSVVYGAAESVVARAALCEVEHVPIQLARAVGQERVWSIGEGANIFRHDFVLCCRWVSYK